jgi:hypothetical protein
MKIIDNICALSKPSHIILHLSIAFALAGVEIPSAVAGEYKLTQGEGVAVCAAYQRNLEPRHDLEPMACERQYDVSIPGFAAVKWRNLSLKEYFQLYREAETQLATHVYGGQGMTLSETSAKEMAEDLRGKAQHLGVELYVARVPLFGRARVVNVLSVRELACGATPKANVRISRLFVLNESMTHIDPREQKLLEGWNNNATIELYEGTPYLEGYAADDNWGTLFTGSGVLSIAKFTKGGFEAVCRISFTPSSQTK